MGNGFYDWKNDEELASNDVTTPPTNEEINDRIIRDLLDGYEYSPSGLLQKNVTLDMKYVKDSNPIYVDDLGNKYQIFIDENGEVVEYITLASGELLYFINPEHTLGVLGDGSVYVYDSETKSYKYNPKLIAFPDNKKTR